MGKKSKQMAPQRERKRKENGRPTAGVFASRQHQSEAEKEEAQGSFRESPCQATDLGNVLVGQILSDCHVLARSPNAHFLRAEAGMISAETNNGGVRRQVNELRRTLAAEWTRSSTLRGLGGRIAVIDARRLKTDWHRGGGGGFATAKGVRHTY
jgi:hypothetical protein